MTAIPFDTLKMVQRLESAGVPSDQAKVQAAVLAEVISAEDLSITERFSAKADVLAELAGIRASIEKMDTRLDSKIDKTVAEAKAELVRWVVGVGMLQMALIAGLVLKLVPH
ncbi:hypothetical protein [Massilia genomosp. 1]|uniref:DUF1640 domain-containing protein n=1 Tax=Massilia genomosp. 1 TaxID=2609280 RepID=A0ABX0MWG8_9BURK|nr:hypothetical protein [Massilia genomosp. 1]NHZ67112.1 hypothetical protein [Massilia genomosp. 1]